MKFKTKMMLVFTVFIVVLAMATGFSFYKYTNRQYELSEKQTMEFYGRHITENINNNIDSMVNITRYLLSAKDVLDSLYALAAYHTIENYDGSYKIDALETINKNMNTDYINLSFYRIIIFNKYGDILVNKNYGDTYADTKKDIRTVSWLSKADERPGENIIVGQHTDDWGIRQKPQVYSVVKKMVGSMECYIEVQYRVDDAESFINLKDDDKSCILFNDSGDMIFQSGGTDNRHLKKYRQEKSGQYETETSIITVDKDNQYGITVIVSEEKSVWLSKTSHILYMTFLVAGIFMLVSLIYVGISVSYLTKPVIEMKKLIDKTELSDLSGPHEVGVPVDEIEALKFSYQKLLGRLHETMMKEQHMATLNLQARLDILQSQINPHFIYNVLNVISGRGILDDDEEICNICGCLAAMLRYTTNTADRTAALKDEMDYVKMYGYLLKSRYEDRFEFSAHIPERLKEVRVPKMVIQQIVENCAEHGFGSSELLKIDICGEDKEECWTISVKDNGAGFEAGKKEEIYQMFERIKERLTDERQLYESKIGGMGLANAYARMYLLFGNAFEMYLENDSGAKVTITVWRDNHV